MRLVVWLVHLVAHQKGHESASIDAPHLVRILKRLADATNGFGLRKFRILKQFERPD